MDYYYTLFILSCTMMVTAAWSVPFYPVRGPPRITRYAHPPHHRIPVQTDEVPWQRPKRDQDDFHNDRDRDHDHDYDHDHNHGRKPTSGVTGPVHTFVKTDKNANYKWGVRHHVGNKYAS